MMSPIRNPSRPPSNVRLPRTLTVMVLASVLLAGAVAHARQGCVMLDANIQGEGAAISTWVDVRDFASAENVLYSGDANAYDRGDIGVVALTDASPCVEGNVEQTCTRFGGTTTLNSIDRADSETRVTGLGPYNWVRLTAACEANDCIGGTNDAANCSASSECPGGVCGCRTKAYFCGGSGGHE